MSRAAWKLALSIGCVIAILGCGGEQPADTADEEPLPALPFERISSDGDDPAENGPDDDTVIEAVPGGVGGVKFPHFTHASNAKAGFGVPCRSCHHTAAAGEDPAEGCVDCHEAPAVGADPADLGPEDNLVLAGDGQDLAANPAVGFNHFSHASSRAYKIACERCHHTGDPVQCTECHQPIAKRTDEGQVVPKGKRAFHRLCLGCHEALVDSDPSSPAPGECAGCHSETGPKRLGGHLTLNRAYHFSCVGCHTGVARAKPETRAPIRACTVCHAAGSPWLPTAAQAAAEKRAAAAEAKRKALEAAQAAMGDAGVGDMDPGPATIVFAHGLEKKPTIPLTHHAHQGYGTCMDCHHEGLDDPKCTNCHKPEESKNIYHKQCKDGCHKEKGAPTGCKDCHPK
jgi:hypothetical protein